jgi:hypothetical protein
MGFLEMKTMKNILILTFFLADSMALLAQTLFQSELVSKPTASSFAVKLTFSNPAEVAVQYGTQSGNLANQTSWQTFQVNEPTEILVTGLQSNTQYYYRIIYRTPGGSVFTTRPERKCHTQRPPGSTFNFIVQADPHLDEQSDTAVYARCLQNQLDDNPDFVLDLGDFLMTDKLKRTGTNTIPFDTIPYRCKLLRKYYEKAYHSIPLFNVLGNHEGEAGWFNNNTANNIAVWDAQQRNKYFNNPEPDGFYSGDTLNTPFVGKRKSYYAWHWGDALFIVLDPYWNTKPKPDSLHGWRWSLGKTQYDWLKKTLETSTSTYKFIFSHQIVGGTAEGRGGVEVSHLYEWGGKNLDGTEGFATNRPGWYKPIKDLLAEHRVNIFFHGHDHFFGKQQRNCLYYQETPQPSHPNFSTVNYADDYGYFEGQIQPNSGHIRVNVSPAGVRVDYVRVYKPQNETPTRQNKDVSATYFIGPVNCYDSLTTEVPMIWNSSYKDELIYPNPADKDVQIEFGLDKEEFCQLEIMDMQGKLVKRILDRTPVPAGKFLIHWDRNDGQGNRMPSGQYAYWLIKEKSGSVTGKIILK